MSDELIVEGREFRSPEGRFAHLFVGHPWHPECPPPPTVPLQGATCLGIPIVRPQTKNGFVAESVS